MEQDIHATTTAAMGQQPQQSSRPPRVEHPSRAADRQQRLRIRQSRGFWRLLRANLYDLALLLRQSWFTLMLFAVVLAAGTGYEYLHDHAHLSKAIYNTLQLLIFQSSEPFPDDALGQTLFILLPLLGLLVVVQSVLTFGRRVLNKESRQEAWQIALATTFRDHVIVCGLGRVGVRVVTRLIETGHEVIIVERDFQSRFVARALSMHVPVVVGDASEVLTLHQAGLARARAVIAGIDNDQLNIEIALAARTTRPDIRVVLRAFSENLDRNLERIFGPDSAFSHSALAAPTIAASTVSRQISYALPLGNDLVGVVRLTVAPDSQLSGSVHDYEADSGIRVLDHRTSAGKPVRHHPGTAFHTGDQLTLLGTLPALEATRLRNIVGDAPLPLQHPVPGHNAVIVCGIGKIGYRMVKRLAQLPNPPDIVAISLPEDGALLQRIIDLPGITVIRGDARDPETLRRAGLDLAYSVAAVTSNDLTNLQIALAARAVCPDIHLVVRVFSDALADELNTVFKIHGTYSTSNLASPTLAAAAVLQHVDDGGVSRAFTVANRLYASDEFTAQPHGILTGLAVDQIRTQHSLLVIALERDGQHALFPPHDTIVQPGDICTLVAPLEALEVLKRA